jgi:D-alanyl-D-alanine carboxypeptidase
MMPGPTLAAVSWALAVVLLGVLAGAMSPVMLAQTLTGADSVDALPARLAHAAASLGPDEINHSLLAATREDALPDGYVPPDLVSLAAFAIPERGGGSLRRIVVPDLQAMIAAAREDGVDLWVSSGYRSYATQVSTYGYFARARGIEWADTRSARPGHSQHQLGTAIDFNTPAQFSATPAGQWLSARAHEFGFVFPYTPASSARTGYVPEPWHVRWVGRDLAQLMSELGYQNAADFIADDYVAAARSALIQATADHEFSTNTDECRPIC